MIICSLNNVTKKFRESVVLDDLNLSIREGELILITGPNGSGKSTLVEILTGQTQADSGSLEVLTERPTRLASRGLFGAWQRIYQRGLMGIRSCVQSAPLFNSLNLSWNAKLADPFSTAQLNFSPVPSGTFRKNHEFIHRYENSTGKTPGTMSFGERRAFAIQRQTAFLPRLCVLDEPCAGLDIKNTNLLRRELKAISGSDTSVIVIEHVSNVPKILDLFNRAYELHSGRLRPISLEALGSEETTAVALGSSHLSISPNVARLGDGQRHSEGMTVRVNTRSPKSANSLPPLLTEVSASTLHFGRCGVHYMSAPNGWGKSTLCSEISGFQSKFPIDVEVFIEGMDISSLSPQKRRQMGLAFLRTEPDFPTSMRVGSLFRAARAEPDLRSTKFLNREFASLSGGEKRYILLDLFLSLPNLKYCLLDEPFLGLDNENTKLARRKIDKLGETACIVILEPA